jgi:hypothetical protein
MSQHFRGVTEENNIYPTKDSLLFDPHTEQRPLKNKATISLA